MNRKTLLSIGSAFIAMGVMSVAGYGCGDDDDAVTTKTDSGTTTETGTGTETGTPETSTPNPAPPALGAQIDRMGRPAINTALNNTFNADTAAQSAAKDAYNKDTDLANWSKTFGAETSKNLATLDGLDGVCGNQFLVNVTDAGPNYENARVYGGLGGVTADDRLWLDTNGATCNTYLAVEGQATGLIPNTDCGGRALKYDVIDITYSAAAKGTIIGVGDGIDADPVKTAATAFPFLSAPQ
jgi:hypothetical protein